MISPNVITELIGLAKGVMADGIVVEQEAAYILNWMEQNKIHAHTWPYSALYTRIGEMLEDKRLDATEQRELMERLLDIIEDESRCEKKLPVVSSIPFDDPVPAILFRKKNFCFTGEFIAGSKAEMKLLATKNGGKPQNDVRADTDYVIVGSKGSSNWALGVYGRKVERAIDYRNRGLDIAIVRESDWHSQINGL